MPRAWLYTFERTVIQRVTVRGDGEDGRFALKDALKKIDGQPGAVLRQHGIQSRLTAWESVGAKEVYVRDDAAE